LIGAKAVTEFIFIPNPEKGLWFHFIARTCLRELCVKFSGKQALAEKNSKINAEN